MHGRLLMVGVALVIGCGTPLVVQGVDQAAAAQAQQQADAQQTDQLWLSHALPGTPPDVAAAFVTVLGEGGHTAAEDGCGLFDQHAAAQFSAAHHAPDCVAAMLSLQEQVTDPSTYVNGLSVPDNVWVQDGATATVNGCALNWAGLFTETPVTPPGPLPGRLIVTQLDGDGWQITEYQAC